MKQRIFNTGIFAVIGFVAASMAIIPSIANAQSVTIGTIPSASFCMGDPISVSFTATGYWQHRNAFTLQLSDPSGSFTSGFTNVGSIQDTLPGTFTIDAAIPVVASSTHYRFRIMAALPYTTSADNGSDIAIGQVPQATISISDTDVAVGHPAGIWASVSSLDTAFWDYGSGATVVGDSLRYSTGGEKTVTLRVVSTGGVFRNRYGDASRV